MILNTEMTSVQKSGFEVWLNQDLQVYVMDLSATISQKDTAKP